MADVNLARKATLPLPFATPIVFVRTRAMAWSTLVVAVGIVAASTYGLLAPDAYRGLAETTVLGAKAQDVCSIAVGVLLVALVRRRRLSARAQVIWLALGASPPTD